MHNSSIPTALTKKSLTESPLGMREFFGVGLPNSFLHVTNSRVGNPMGFVLGFAWPTWRGWRCSHGGQTSYPKIWGLKNQGPSRLHVMAAVVENDSNYHDMKTSWIYSTHNIFFKFLNHFLVFCWVKGSMWFFLFLNVSFESFTSKKEDYWNPSTIAVYESTSTFSMPFISSWTINIGTSKSVQRPALPSQFPWRFWTFKFIHGNCDAIIQIHIIYIYISSIFAIFQKHIFTNNIQIIHIIVSIIALGSYIQKRLFENPSQPTRKAMNSKFCHTHVERVLFYKNDAAKSLMATPIHCAFGLKIHSSSMQNVELCFFWRGEIFELT